MPPPSSLPHRRTRNPRAGGPRENSSAHLPSILSAVIPRESDVEGTTNSPQTPPPFANPTTRPDRHGHPSTSGPLSHFERGSESRTPGATLHFFNPLREVAPLPSTLVPTSVPPLQALPPLPALPPLQALPPPIYYQSPSTSQLDRRGIAAAISMTSPKIVSLSPDFSEAFSEPIFQKRKGCVRRHFIDPVKRIVHNVLE
jgi:hypothetical protein